MSQILIGISSWADPELIDSGFYPPEIKTAEERLHHYSLNFPVVELDSSYHYLPTQRNLTNWIGNTKPGFVFDVKAFSLLTQHPTMPSSLPRDMREKAAAYLNREGHLYIHSLPEDMVKQVWERFAASILPLQKAGKLGVISFQFPTWFHVRPENYNYVAECRARLPQYRLAIEFRTRGWLNDEHRDYTLKFLSEKGLSLVCVDEPQGSKYSVQPVAEVTASPGMVRFHGRNAENWEKKDVTVYQKYNYLYNEAELNEWEPKIRAMADKTSEVYVIFKNKHLDYAVKNARQMIELLK